MADTRKEIEIVIRKGTNVFVATPIWDRILELMNLARVEETPEADKIAHYHQAMKLLKQGEAAIRKDYDRMSYRKYEMEYNKIYFIDCLTALLHLESHASRKTRELIDEGLKAVSEIVSAHHFITNNTSLWAHAKADQEEFITNNLNETLVKFYHEIVFSFSSFLNQDDLLANGESFVNRQKKYLTRAMDTIFSRLPVVLSENDRKMLEASTDEQIADSYMDLSNIDPTNTIPLINAADHYLAALKNLDLEEPVARHAIHLSYLNAVHQLYHLTHDHAYASTIKSHLAAYRVDYDSMTEEQKCEWDASVREYAAMNVAEIAETRDAHPTPKRKNSTHTMMDTLGVSAKAAKIATTATPRAVFEAAAVVAVSIPAPTPPAPAAGEPAVAAEVAAAARVLPFKKRWK